MSHHLFPPNDKTPPSIIALQETHSETANEQNWRDLMYSNVLFAHGVWGQEDNHIAGGVLLAFRTNLQHKILLMKTLMAVF